MEYREWETGNYQIAGGRVHRFSLKGSGVDDLYECGLGILGEDPKTRKPVTCLSCLRRMEKK